MSSTLDQKQRRFPLMIATLIQWAYSQGYEITFGEAYRSDEQSEINALGGARAEVADLIAAKFPDLAAKIRNNVGSGIRTSLHGERLAIDLNLFINGTYQQSTEAYRPLGQQWEQLGGTWGGRFASPDGNHFSIAHDGRA
jgi:hypothetical protein